jgi:hypothetical protein
LAVFLLLASGVSIWSAQGKAAGGANHKISIEQANALVAKLHQLSTASAPPGSSFKPVVITDEEANSYLKFRGSDFLPKGVSDTILHIMPGGIQGMAMVDFDQLQIGENQDDFGSKIVSLMFQGRQRVSAFGELQSSNGKATLKIEDVRIGAKQLNDWLVNWLLQYYLQSEFHIDLSKPLSLPDHVLRVELSSGRATLLRSASRH